MLSGPLADFVCSSFYPFNGICEFLWQIFKYALELPIVRSGIAVTYSFAIRVCSSCVESAELIPSGWLWSTGRHPMPAPLSRDLGERIVHAVAGGSSIRQAALRFDVSPSAAVKLMRRFRQNGSPAPGPLWRLSSTHPRAA